ncbi:MAG: type II secretion system F family protein [Longimicrobiales bacterium]|nr:type II secretion system F family protein [Longimicrobiales bacterium]
MPRPDPWFLAAAAAASAVLAVFVLFQAMAAFREWRLRRDALATLKDRDLREPSPEVQGSLIRARADRDSGFLTELADRVPWLWDLEHVLVQSGLSWTLEKFAARTGVVAAMAGVIALLIFGSRWVAAGAFLLAGITPYLYARWRRRKRIQKLEMQLPEAIDLIARAVRAGHPLSAGLGMAAEEVPEPLASEFRITFEEQKFGLPFEEALLGFGDRVEIVDARILITAILVQREVGGNLTEILETIAETMRDRFNLKRQVRVYTAQGRMSGYTLAALPILVGLVITVINPDYMTVLLHETVGRGMLVGAAALQLIGFIWIRNIVDVRY